MDTDLNRSPLFDDLVAANRILAVQGLLDGFGHLSARHPTRAGHFVMSRMRAPRLVTRADLVEVDLDGVAVDPVDARLPAERAIHAAMYRARPDVAAVCHHHAPSMLPFCVAQVPLVPVFHVGATMGSRVPLWDGRTEFGDTDLLVVTAAQGDSLARTLGDAWTVLMRGHGTTVVARSVREMVFRCVYGARNAELQLAAGRLGPVAQLSAGEAAAASECNLRPPVVDRAWDLWIAQAYGLADRFEPSGEAA
ncbi:MAG: class II aldolase/adducin family protein [Lautropia sp.]